MTSPFSKLIINLTVKNRKFQRLLSRNENFGESFPFDYMKDLYFLQHGNKNQGLFKEKSGEKIPPGAYSPNCRNQLTVRQNYHYPLKKSDHDDGQSK